ncbi:MAG: hypothetical protein ACKVQJ_01260 [Pyrinomonadaceae bacterium]
MLILRRCIIVALAVCSIALSTAAQTNKAIEADLLRHLTNLEKASGVSGARNEAAVDKENKILKQNFLLYGKKAATLKYDFKALAGKMTITTSKDGKFRIYSWDNEFGGTMRDHENIFQYQAKGGQVYAYLVPRGREGDVHGFYHQIFQVDTPTGRVYLANSTFIASTSLASQELSLFRTDGKKLNSNVRLIQTKTRLTNSVGFQYDFFSVVDHPERPVKLFFYDEAKKSFRFPVVIEDAQTPQGRVTKKFITYRFNGKYFVKVR